ncbi:hypothetical protein LQZ19_06790 [Treponema primitia]|uniref:hypothetical protein n=1 Tax=Treponema primitia TaxID=88058 RepID=UPI003980C1A1
MRKMLVCIGVLLLSGINIHATPYWISYDRESTTQYYDHSITFAAMPYYGIIFDDIKIRNNFTELESEVSLQHQIFGFDYLLLFKYASFSFININIPVLLSSSGTNELSTYEEDEYYSNFFSLFAIDFNLRYPFFIGGFTELAPFVGIELQPNFDMHKFKDDYQASFSFRAGIQALIKAFSFEASFGMMLGDYYPNNDTILGGMVDIPGGGSYYRDISLLGSAHYSVTLKIGLAWVPLVTQSVYYRDDKEVHREFYRVNTLRRENREH